ncbi:MAG TPA: Arm DNA-binding domain-containing protein [Candidatus Obscuribacterales bacterium]
MTDNFIEKQVVAPPHGQVIIRDDVLQGFAVRVTRGSISYIAECRVQGVNRRITIGRHGKWTPESARKEARRLLGLMAAGQDPMQEKKRSNPASITLGQAFEEYMSSKQFRKNSILSFNRVMAQSLGDWLSKPVTKITKNMVEERFTELSSGSKWGTSGKANANLTMQVLRAVLNYISLKYEVNGEGAHAEDH